MFPSDKMPILSGDISSTELTASQAQVVDMLTSVGRIAMVAGETPIKFTVEREGGLESYLRQVQEAVDAGHPMKADEVEELQQKVRYQERTEKLGNVTESYRLLLGRLHQDKYFQQCVQKMIEETINLSEKRSENRRLAEKAQSKDLGL